MAGSVRHTWTGWGRDRICSVLFGWTHIKGRGVRYEVQSIGGSK